MTIATWQSTGDECLPRDGVNAVETSRVNRDVLSSEATAVFPVLILKGSWADREPTDAHIIQSEIWKIKEIECDPLFAPCERS